MSRTVAELPALKNWVNVTGILDHLHDILHYILDGSHDSAVQMLLIILMLALPCQPCLPFLCNDLLLACSTDLPQEVHSAFDISCCMSGCDAAGHGFKPQW